MVWKAWLNSKNKEEQEAEGKVSLAYSICIVVKWREGERMTEDG